jgi:hypothetical protein
VAVSINRLVEVVVVNINRLVKEVISTFFCFAIANAGSSSGSNPPPHTHTNNIQLLHLERIPIMVRLQLHSILPHLQNSVVAENM